MQGTQIVAYVDAELDPEFKRPIGATKIIKSWAPTHEKAVQKKRTMEQKYGGIVRLK